MKDILPLIATCRELTGARAVLTAVHGTMPRPIGERVLAPHNLQVLPPPTPSTDWLGPLAEAQLPSLDVILVPNFNLGSILIVLIPIFLENNFKTNATEL